jgi:hypothetical protein
VAGGIHNAAQDTALAGVTAAGHFLFIQSIIFTARRESKMFLFLFFMFRKTPPQIFSDTPIHDSLRPPDPSEQTAPCS